MTSDNELTILLLTPRQASKALNICERTLYGLAKSGKLPVVKIGRSVRFSIEDLKEYIKKSSDNSQKSA